MFPMETRKVQRTGKSTLIVSLPKNWTKKSNISVGSVLFIKKSQNGSLVLMPHNSEPNLMTRLEIGNKSGEVLVRDIIACYIAGYRTIEITSPQLSSIQRKQLRIIANKLIGPEIMEDAPDKMIIQDLLSTEELQTEQALKRIKNMTRQMIHDSITALVKKNVDLAQDVVQRDDEVDRLNLFVARQFMEILRSKSVKHESVSAISAFNQMQAASNLERIADHASKMAQTAVHQSCMLPGRLEEELPRAGSSLCTLMDECIPVLIHGDSNKANRLIDSILATKKQIQAMLGSIAGEDPIEMHLKLTLTDSLERILDHMININELTINMRNASLDE